MTSCRGTLKELLYGVGIALNSPVNIVDALRLVEFPTECCGPGFGGFDLEKFLAGRREAGAVAR